AWYPSVENVCATASSPRKSSGRGSEENIKIFDLVEVSCSAAVVSCASENSSPGSPFQKKNAAKASRISSSIDVLRGWGESKSIAQLTLAPSTGIKFVSTVKPVVPHAKGTECLSPGS